MKKPRYALPLRERIHLRMAHMDTLGHLSLLGVICGLLAGLVIVAFRYLIEETQGLFLPGGNPENYEGLAWWLRLLLPIIGGLLVGLLLHSVTAERRQTGVVHVMERLSYHQAQLPLLNGVIQFFGAAICLIFGHSVGREGPAVHLGATSGSQLSQWLRLPNNSTRTLVACGVAAAIAASFNTPLAGVIFSMEVVLMEYTLAGFIPVILAAVAATVLMQLFYGNEPAFSVPAMELGSLGELPYILVTGMAIGCLAALFIQSLGWFSRTATTRPIWQRTTAAGIIIGLCAVLLPQIMGVGYDTVNSAMMGEMGLVLLLLIIAFKLFATTAGLGLGLPGGLIGPTLVIGACAGAAANLIATTAGSDNLSSIGLYAMIGMGAMMGATLQAPLAALVALLELTANPNIIMPGMLAIVSANLVSSQLFGQPSVFIMIMRARGLDYHTNPVAQSLRRIAVTNAMDRDVVSADKTLSTDALQKLMQAQPHWFVIRDKHYSYILPAADVAAALTRQDASTPITLDSIPAARRQAVAVDMRATLQEALDLLTKSRAEALYVTNNSTPEPRQVYGVLTRQDIEEHYHYQPNK